MRTGLSCASLHAQHACLTCMPDMHERSPAAFPYLLRLCDEEHAVAVCRDLERVGLVYRVFRSFDGQALVHLHCAAQGTIGVSWGVIEDALGVIRWCMRCAYVHPGTCQDHGKTSWNVHGKCHRHSVRNCSAGGDIIGGPMLGPW